MSEFKPNKIKAGLTALPQVLYDRVEAVVQPILVASPQLTLPIMSVVGATGFLLAYNQEKLNQFTQYLLEHQKVFDADILEDKSFIEGMSIFIQSYVRLRSDKKLEHAQNIFLNFSLSDDKQIYPLERYDDTLEKISDRALEYLGFVYINLPAIKKEYISSKVHQNGNSIDSGVDWNEVYGKLALGEYLEFYIQRQTDLQMESYMGIEDITEITRIKQSFYDRFLPSQEELEQLGLGKYVSKPITYNNQGSYFILNGYGLEFLSVIKPETL